MIQGNVEYQIEGYRFTTAPGSLILIPPSVSHGMTTKTTDPYCRISIHFRPAFLDEDEQDSLLKMFKAEGVYYPDLAKTGIGFLVQSVFDCKKMEASLQKIALKSRIVSLLTHIYHLSSQKITDTTIVDKRIQNILLYLNSNLQKSFSLGEIARKFRISKNYLNVLFHHGTGMTVNQYIRMKRLIQARQSILNGLTAEEAAWQAGFNDYSNFFRAYKSYFGIMPSASNKDWHTIHQNILF
jgi:AraC-like DNA-binding protein